MAAAVKIRDVIIAALVDVFALHVWPVAEGYDDDRRIVSRHRLLTNTAACGQDYMWRLSQIYQEQIGVDAPAQRIVKRMFFADRQQHAIAVTPQRLLDNVSRVVVILDVQNSRAGI